MKFVENIGNKVKYSPFLDWNEFILTELKTDFEW